MNRTYLGIDLGGTNFKLGKVKDQVVIEKVTLPVDSSQNETTLLEQLYDGIAQIVTDEVQAIGVGVPGVVNPDNGMIYDIQNLPAWKEVGLQRLLEKRFGVPVKLNNDANCFALGEHRFGVGRRYQNFVGLSIGTGLGMGIIINGQLYNGVLCGAGEIGMIPYKDDVIEQYAGSFFFTKKYQQSAKEIHDLALRRQPQALAAYEEFGQHLGEAIKIILLAYAPEAIVIGGSIGEAYAFFRDGMESSISGFVYPAQLEALEVAVSKDKDIAILGAAALVM